MTNTLTDGQKAVLSAFHGFGPMDDVALTVYVHHISDVPMSSSGIRTRRSELLRKGLLEVTGAKRLKSGRFAHVHGLTPAGKRLARALQKSRVPA